MLPGFGFAGLAAPGLNRWIRREAPWFDMVHVHLARDLVTLPAARAALAADAPLVVQTHGMIDPSANRLAVPLDRFVTRDVLRRAQTVLYLNARERELLLAVERRLSNLVELPNGIEATSSEPSDPAQSREVLFLGRLHERKNPGQFVEAAARLQAKHPEWTFAMVGPDEGEALRVQELAAEAGATNASWEGSISPDRVPERMRRAAIYALPARDEPYPMTVLEAMSAGLPVVVTETCGLSAAVRETGSGLVTNGSVEHLATSLDKLMSSSSLRTTMGANARRAAVEGHSIVSIADRLVGVYAACARGRNENDRERVVWLTNFAAPYRRPLWTALGRSVDLTVLLSGYRGSREGSVRGRDWFQPSAGVYTQRSLATGPLAPLRWTRSLWLALVATRQADVLVLGEWQTPLAWYLLGLGLLRRQRVIGFYESTQETQRFKRGPAARGRALFFRGLHAVVTPGISASRAVLAMGVPPDRVHTGFNAVDVDQFHDTALAAREAQLLSPESGHRFVYVGQFIGRKNLAALVDAFASVASSTDTLTLIGDGSEDDAIRQQIRRRGIDRQVQLLPQVINSDLPAIMGLHHTLVLPSTAEVWGLVVNEALAAGLHAVVSRDCGVADSVKGMPGVFICDSSQAGISSGLRESRAAWTTWNLEHPILTETPERFSSTFLTAIRD